MSVVEPAPLRVRRAIAGHAAVLLPFRNGAVDWPSFEALLGRVVASGLTPAVNMDTGYVQLLDEATRERVVDVTASVLGGEPFVAGAMVDDAAGAAFDEAAYRKQLDAIAARGATPIVFPSFGLNALDDDDWVAAHAALARDLDRFLGFELGPMFVPYGRIYSTEAFRGLLAIPTCAGAKHSSLDRALEWDRLAIRDAVRPDFMVLTGNDLAIDMVCYGSDYLLGLAMFAPDHFARRDALWATGDRGFYGLNDTLQYLGQFAFRAPVPAYRHSAAQFLSQRGWIPSDDTPAGAFRRPDTDRDVLALIAERLDG